MQTPLDAEQQDQRDPISATYFGPRGRRRRTKSNQSRLRTVFYLVQNIKDRHLKNWFPSKSRKMLTRLAGSLKLPSGQKLPGVCLSERFIICLSRLSAVLACASLASREREAVGSQAHGDQWRDCVCAALHRACEGRPPASCSA